MVSFVWRKKRGNRPARRHDRLRSTRAALRPEAAFYRSALRALGKGGIPKPESLPPLAHADRLAARQHPASEPLSAIASLYYKLRFGNHPLSDAELAAAQRDLTTLRASTARGSRRRRV